MPTRRDYRCPSCHYVVEKQVGLTEETHVHCPQDGALMQRYFGTTRDLPINFGYRENRYSTDTDARIAQYQFENL